MVPRFRTTRSLRSSAAARLAALILALLGTPAAWAIPPGALDPDFGDGVHAGWVQLPMPQGGHGSAVVVDPQGRVLVGSREVELGTIYVVVRRFLPSGALDATFGSGGHVTVTQSPAETTEMHLALAENGDLFVGTTEAGTALSRNFRIDKYDSSGAFAGVAVVDFNYGTDSAETLYDLTVAAGRVLAVGRASWSGADTDFAIAALNAATLDLDPTFAGTGRLIVPFDLGGNHQDEAHAVVRRSDGRIVVGGSVSAPGSGVRAALLRLLPDGTLDPTFGAGGRATFACTPTPGNAATETFFYALALEPDGTIWAAGATTPPVAGADRDFALARILADGALDASWATAGWAVVAFTYPGGSTSTRDRALFVARDAAGGLLLAGENVDALSPPYRFAAAAVRLLADGTPDPGYGANGGGLTQLVLTASAYTWPEGADLDPNGGLLLTGGVREPGAQHTDAFVARLVGRPVFRDGFESGSTAAWSSTTP